MKLKELLSGLSSLALSEAEVVSVMALLREKSPNTMDAWHKVRFRCAVYIFLLPRHAGAV